MDYEKAYNEAIKRAKAIIEVAEKEEEVYKSAITIFPELRESEDERIRKKLIHLVKKSHEQGGYALHKWEADEMLAWLEKQGEERTINYPIEGMFPYTEPADTLDGEIENIWNNLRNCDNTFTAAKSGFYKVIHHFANWFEKQSYTKKDVDDAYLKGICNTKHELEKQGEQKSVDKIEPKFHEGEWIISNDKKSTYQVIEVKRGIYVIRDNVDNHEYHIGIEECEKSGRLFTIQDAKDGDVLSYVTDEEDLWIMIYWSLYEPYEGHVHYHALLVNDNFSDKGTCCICINDLKPATKEQRDLLFSKMKEVGYEWNSEKKELKKLSQRMISAEAKEALYDKPTDEEMKELLRTEYEKGRADTLSEMKSSWSEEDEKRLQSCINILKAKSLMGKVDTANTMWLKSLKQRIGG